MRNKIGSSFLCGGIMIEILQIIAAAGTIAAALYALASPMKV